MWFLLGWLLGRGRRWRGPEEREWRRRRGHPFSFVVVVFMAGSAFADGSIGWGLILLGIAMALVAWGL